MRLRPRQKAFVERSVAALAARGNTLTYATDAEMASAIADLERRIAETKAGARRRFVRTTASKGL